MEIPIFGISWTKWYCSAYSSKNSRL